MAEIAQVRSIDALDVFRASLIVFRDKARPVVEEIGTDLRRTQLWLESDRIPNWKREVLRRTRILESAQQALLSARIATFREATPVEQNAVDAARRSLDEAEQKIRTLKRWIRDFGPRTESLARQVGALDSVLAQDIPRAIAWMTQALLRLEDYADVHGSPSRLSESPRPVAPPASSSPGDPSSVKSSPAMPLAEPSPEAQGIPSPDRKGQPS